MVDIAKETPITLQEAAELLKKSYFTVYRWAKYGLRGRMLETRMVGASIYTSREAIQRFSTGPEQEASPAPPVRNLADERAKKNLARRGVDGGKWKQRIAVRAAKELEQRKRK